MQQRKNLELARNYSRRPNPQSSPGMHPTNSNLTGLQLVQWRISPTGSMIGLRKGVGRRARDTKTRLRRRYNLNLLSSCLRLLGFSLEKMEAWPRDRRETLGKFPMRVPEFVACRTRLLAIPQSCHGQDTIRTMNEARRGKT